MIVSSWGIILIFESGTLLKVEIGSVDDNTNSVKQLNICG